MAVGPRLLLLRSSHLLVHAAGAELLLDLQTENSLAAVCFSSFSDTHLITGAEVEALGQFYVWKQRQGFRTQF